jgi:uncharacterized membrane protein
MSRASFLSSLRSGLSGLPAAQINDIVADYEGHFAEGLADGRSEADVESALGEPGRLARELRAEAGLKRWETERNASSAAGAIFAVLSLGAIDIIILLPILFVVICVIFALSLAAIGVFAAGVAVTATALVGNLPGFEGTQLQGVLLGIGLMSGAISVGALQGLKISALVSMLVWYGRLHYRLLKPAIEPQGV